MYLKNTLISLIALFMAAGVYAQSNTMYYQSGPPQAYWLNPATQPICNVFVGIPVLNNLYVETYNTGALIADMLWNAEYTSDVLHPLHPDANLDDFLANFNDENEFLADLYISPISFGFRIKDMYFTFDVTSRSKLEYYYPYDLVSFALKGNQNNTTYNFNSLGLSLSEHMEFGLGVSRKFADMFTIGIRPKLLTGLATIHSTDNSISLFTSTEEWVFESQLEMQMAVSGLNIPVNEEGNFDPSGEFSFDSTLSSASDFRELAFRNKGFGIDIGAHVEVLEGLTLSASVLDLGFIKWKENLHTATLEGNYRFEGVEFNTDDTIQFVEYLWDSIKADFTVNGNSDPFTTFLDPKIYIGGTLELHPKLDAGILARFDFQETGVKTNVMVHANWHPNSAFSLSASYSPFGRRANTFGLGLFFRAGPLGIYTIADYRSVRYRLYKYESIPFFAAPANRARFNTQIGINIMIGSNRKKKLMKDKPMYYSMDY